MNQRLNVFALGVNSINALFGVGQAIRKSSLEKSLLELVAFRVSQLNDCAYCLDMHYKDALAKGETDQRLYTLSAWREAPFYSDRERAALAWAEEVTLLEKHALGDSLYEEVLRHFSETELADLTMAIIGTNCYNRLNRAFGANVGSYKVGQFEKS